MNKVIVYRHDNGRMAIVVPTQEAIDRYGIEAIAIRDVPSPKTVFDVPTGIFNVDEETGESYEVMGPREKRYAFKIVDASVVPIDRSERDSWTVPDEDLTDGFGADIDLSKA